MDKIIALCKKYKVAKLWVFGSIFNDRFNDQSDVDSLVEFDEGKVDILDYTDNYFDLIHSIEAIIGRKKIWWETRQYVIPIFAQR